MKWSKLKQRVEANFVPELQGRVQLRLVAYRKSHDQPQRGTIVVDGDEWAEFCEVKYNMELYKRERTTGYYAEMTQMKKEMFQETEDSAVAVSTFIDQHEHLNRHYAIREQMKVEMFQPGWLFTAACFSFLNMSIDDAIASNDPLHRLLAILDKRVGKRRLPRIQEQYLEPELLQKFYQLRLDATFGGNA